MKFSGFTHGEAGSDPMPGEGRITSGGQYFPKPFTGGVASTFSRLRAVFWKRPPQPPFAKAQSRGKVFQVCAHLCARAVEVRSQFSPATSWDPRTGLGVSGWCEYTPPAESSLGWREENATAVCVRRAFRTNMVQGLFPSAQFRRGR